ncbi:MAG: hypothetical protein AAB705_00455 [Patescibacteria group bacterium]
MPKLIPKETIKKIKLLRQHGYSLPEIKKVVNVGHGSVFRYIQGVEILPEYRKIWHSKRGGSFKRMKLAEKKAEEKADEYIVRLSEKEKLIFLSALYWGEGSKGDFGLTNSDPDLIKVFVLGLKEVFKISTDRLRISIRIYNDLNREKCLKFWSTITGVPVPKFVSVNVLEGKKEGKLPYGMCRVRVTKGADVLKYMKALKNKIIDLF